MANFHGTAGNDTFSGTTGDDTFKLFQGGEDTATGDDGNDTFVMKAALDAGDAIDGGAGADRVTLKGNYSGGLTFGAATMTNVETLRLTGAFDYALTLNDGNVAAGERLSVNAGPLASGHHLTFDGSAETDGRFTIFASAGGDVLTGGTQDDRFNLAAGGADTAHGGGGNDIFKMRGGLSQSDQIDGGAGNDRIFLNGNYGTQMTFNASTLTGVETINLGGGHSYDFVSNDGNVAAGANLKVDASALANVNTVSFDGSAETDGSFTFFDGAGFNFFKGGGGNDTFTLNSAFHDVVAGNGGDDTFYYADNFNSAHPTDGGGGADTIVLNGNYGLSLTTLAANTLVNVERFVMTAGHSYIFATNDANVAAGATLTVDASQLSGFETADFRGGAETNGKFDFILGTGFNYFTGGTGNDSFEYQTNTGGTLNGGGGTDTMNISMEGDSLSLGTGLSNIEVINLTGEHDYTGVTLHGDIGGGHMVKVDTSGAGLLFGTFVNIDASDCADAVEFKNGLNAGASGYTLTGTSHDDIFDMFDLGVSTIDGFDVLKGGAGFDELKLGASTMTFTDSVMTNIEKLTGVGASMNIALADGNIAAGQTLIVDMSAITGAVQVDAQAETDGAVHFIGGTTGTRHFTGGAGNDIFDLDGEDLAEGKGGGDTFNLGASHVTLYYAGAAASTGTGYDTIHNVDFDGGVTFLNIAASGTNGLFNGNVTTATFDADLGAIFTAAHLSVGNFAAVGVTGGGLLGHIFLVVDANGVAGYQNGGDYVFDITGATGSLGPEDFFHI